MKESLEFPSFDLRCQSLNDFVIKLADEYRIGNIQSWEDLEVSTWYFFTSERMNELESIAPGWKKMVSYSNGVTLVHVMCVFLGLFMLPEFQGASFEHQQLAKWIILFHDIEKVARNDERDLTHGFKSAICAARTLPSLGFAKTQAYEHLIDSWSSFVSAAKTKPEGLKDYIQDNKKIPEILDGIDAMFGGKSPAALIVKGVLLHMSINVVDDWPQAAPLTEDEINAYLEPNLCLLLKLMTLSDNEGWSMFYADEREQQRNDTLKAFEKIEKMLVRQNPA